MDKDRKCRICNASNKDKVFVMRNKVKKIQFNLCRDCSKEQSKKHYNANKDQYAKRNDKYKSANKQLIYDYLLSHPCVDCGESDPIVLEFDHRDPDEKSFRLASVSNYSTDKLILEMNKCDIRCANCHRRKTAKDYNHYRYQLAN